MKEKYINAEIEVIKFKAEDIITTSDPIIDKDTGLPIK